MPRALASDGLISTNISGIISACQVRFRVMAPACQCSVTRKVVAMTGYLGSQTWATRSNSDFHTFITGLDCCGDTAFTYGHSRAS